MVQALQDVVRRKIQIEPYLTLCTQFNSKGIKDFKINPDTMNLIDEKAEIAWNTLAQQQLPEQDTDSTDTKLNT